VTEVRVWVTSCSVEYFAHLLLNVRFPHRRCGRIEVKSAAQSGESFLIDSPASPLWPTNLVLNFPPPVASPLFRTAVEFDPLPLSFPKVALP